MADLASLVLRLSADVASLQNDLGRANAIAERSARAMQKSFDNITGGIKDSVKDLAGAFAAAFTVDKLVEFGKTAIDTADQFEKMSQKVGVSVETLSALSVQAKLADVSTESLQGGLAKLARNAADAAGGSKQQAAAFQAIGVSVKDAAGNLKPMDSLLAEVATKFASYRDSAAKTALAQEYFGKSGADLIPLLNQLGEQGFAKAREEAEKYGAVISGDTAKASEQFNDNLTKLKIEAGGFANAVTAQLLPGLLKLTETMVSAGETTNRYGDAATLVSNAIKGLVVGLVTVKEFLSSVATVTFSFYDAVATTFKAAGEVVAAFGVAAYESIKGAFTLDPQAMAQARENLTANLGKIGADVAKSFTGIKDAMAGGVSQSIANVRTTLDDLFGTFSNVASGADTTAKAFGNLTPPIVANTDATKAQEEALAKLNETQNKAAQFLVQLAGKVSPVDAAFSAYVDTLIKAQKIADDLQAAYIKAGKATEAYGAAQKFMAQAQAGANQVLDLTLDKLARQADVVGRMNDEFANQAALIGLTDREKAIAEAVEKATDEFNKNTEAGIKNAQTLDTVRASAAAGAAGIFDMTKAAKDSQEVARQFTSIWTSAGDQIADAFSKWVVEGGSLMKSLTSIAKQVVEQIIAYFLKLAVINPILNAIFGGSFGMAGGGGLLPTLASASGIFGGGGAGTSFSTSGDLMTAGQTMWTGFKNGFSSFFAGDSGFTMGPPDATGATSSYYGGGYTSGFGQALGIAGGVYAGYNRYQQAGGGLGGIAGGAAYGYGTYIAGAGVATVAATGSLAAGLAAIPVVGWIALAAMVIDMASGGKLFGTKGKFNFGQQAITVGQSGATVTAGYDLKGQQALFGGSTHSWQNLPVDPAAQKAADDFFKQLTNQTESFAKQFGVTMGDVVGGQFIATFDKHGNVTKTQSTVNGVTYTEDQQHFTERLSAENMLAVLDQLDKGISAAVEQYRQDADVLMGVTQALATGEMMLQKGGTFLALGSDQTLTALLKLAEGMQAAGETIDQTLNRIIQAQAQYDQFVGQFKTVTYVDDFEATLAGINAQMNQNIATANALAQAAGAEGASEQDLANIHSAAAQQMAAAIRQLEASAQSLAFSLGLTTTGSLDQVNSEIERLQARRDASHPIRDFGQAMQEAAQRARESISLLIGDLSPLNDLQKLQVALQGLRAGTVSKEDVLGIGRRLYASSQQYTDLFNLVQGINPASAGVPGVGGRVGPGFSSADQKRLDDLLKEQQQLQAAAQLQQYQTLAQQIAEIASAKGEDWQQVVADMGIDLKAFEKGLGMNDQQLNDYITSIQKQTDSAGNNTQSIVKAINDMSDAIVTTLGGTPGRHDDTGTGSADARVPAPRGHSGHGRTITDADADAIGSSVGRNVRGVVMGDARNRRTRAVMAT